MQPYLESLLRTLLSSERNLDVIDDKVRMLVNLVSRLPLENLEDRVGQIMTGLCRQGGPGSNTVAKALMQRLPTAAIVQRLLSDDFLHAKSSKVSNNVLVWCFWVVFIAPLPSSSHCPQCLVAVSRECIANGAVCFNDISEHLL